MSDLKCQNICFAVLPVISMLCEIDFKEASDRMYQNVQAYVEDGTGGIKQSCSLVESIQVKAVPSAFSMRFTDIGLNMPDLGYSHVLAAHGFQSKCQLKWSNLASEAHGELRDNIGWPRSSMN